MTEYTEKYNWQDTDRSFVCFSDTYKLFVWDRFAHKYYTKVDKKLYEFQTSRQPIALSISHDMNIIILTLFHS